MQQLANSNRVPSAHLVQGNRHRLESTMCVTLGDLAAGLQQIEMARHHYDAAVLDGSPEAIDLARDARQDSIALRNLIAARTTQSRPRLVCVDGRRV